MVQPWVGCRARWVLLTGETIWKVPLGPALSSPPVSFPPCALKVAQADSRCPELVWSSGTEVEEKQGPRTSPPFTASRARSPAAQDPALQAVQTALKRRQQQEQVGSQSCPGPHGGRAMKPASLVESLPVGHQVG